jgi:flagellar protein FlaJ
MKNASSLTNKIKKTLEQLRAKFRHAPDGMPNKMATSDVEEKTKMSLASLQAIAYHLVGEKMGRFMPLFKDLDLNLKRSGLKTNFKAYVSLTLFCTAVAAMLLLAIIPFLLFFVTGIPFLPAVLFGVGGSLFAIAFTTIGFYSYPIYRADAAKRQLEDELPFTTGYMAILASAGVSPENIFNSLSIFSVPLALTGQAKDVVRDVNLFGSDIISALEETSKRTASGTFREMIQGFISTIHSGGNLAAYLREKSIQYMRLRKISLRKYSDTLSMLGEFYVALLLTGPLMLIIMLSVMAMLGGGMLGIFSPDLLLNLLTYLGIPLGAIVFLIILDATSPKW